jgi:hypothetical protein
VTIYFTYFAIVATNVYFSNAKICTFKKVSLQTVGFLNGSYGLTVLIVATILIHAWLCQQ